MSEEEKKRILSLLDDLVKDREIPVDQMEQISEAREVIGREIEASEQYREWENKYKDLESSYQRAMEDNARITEAYRKRWDESTTGTRVNGKYVDKVVTEVTPKTYEQLMRGE